LGNGGLSSESLIMPRKWPIQTVEGEEGKGKTTKRSAAGEFQLETISYMWVRLTVNVREKIG